MGVKVSFQSHVTAEQYKKQFKLGLRRWHEWPSGAHGSIYKGFFVGSFFYLGYRHGLVESIKITNRAHLRNGSCSAVFGRIKQKDGKAFITYKCYYTAMNLLAWVLWVALVAASTIAIILSLGPLLSIPIILILSLVSIWSITSTYSLAPVNEAAIEKYLVGCGELRE